MLKEVYLKVSPFEIDKVAQSMVQPLPLSAEQGQIAVLIRYSTHSHSTQSFLDYAFSSAYVYAGIVVCVSVYM